MLTLRLVVIFAIAASLSAFQAPDEVYKQGHSQHGQTFDIGPRQKPCVLPGIGKAHFPITTANPEAQQWFDQRNAQLRAFWFYEAERSCRSCLKREPESAIASS